jgi:hypothetical protein
MKYLLSAAFSLITLNGTAQADSDMILLHTGERLDVYISSISDRTVTFNYPGEEVEYTRSKNSIEEIVFASGRRADGSEKVSVNGPHDWLKVIITDNPDDIEGLTKKGDLYVKSTATTVFSGAQKIDEKATKKIKQRAAQMGAHIVYVQSQTNDKGIRRANRSIKSGVAYGYR